VAVPYSFDTTPWAHIPAVATDRFVFWITNPSMAMYFAFNDWCSNTGSNPRLAFEAESSYQSIQIWRIDPYEFCPTSINGIRKCPEDQSATFRTLPGFVSGDHSSQTCFQRFNVLAPTMAYVNEYNIAITILETSFVNVDVSTLRPRNASDARYGPPLPPLHLTRVLELHLVVCVHTPFAYETVQSSVVIDLACAKHILHVSLHLEMFDDLRVDLVETHHTRLIATHECVDLFDTVVKAILVALMGCYHLDDFIPVCSNKAFGDQRFKRFGCLRHSRSNACNVIEIEKHERLDIAFKRSPEHNKLRSQRV